jgi:hypothetical protein
VTTIADVRIALADAVATISGVTADPYQRDTVTAPAAQVLRREMDPRLVLGASKQAYAFTVRLFVRRGAEDTAQAQLDEFCAMSGVSSVRAAIEDEDSWPSPAIVDYAQVVLVGETEVQDVAGVQYLTVDFEVEVVW